jgi:NADH:ubiquinone oxidoreductase subunit 5 (subunit L)/multisubunit Na+/H+ antiporter MnhA subunit
MSYISLVPKIGVLGFLTVFLHPLLFININIIILVSSLSIIVGSLGGLLQTEYRRLLAYSSVTHIGYLLLSSIASSSSSVIIYLIQYTFTTIATLYCFNELDKNNTGNISILINTYSTQPYLSGVLGLLLFSLSGIPPLIGFFAKLEVFYSIIEDHYYIVTIIAIITSVIGAFYYLRLMIVIFTTSSSLSSSLYNSSYNSNLSSSLYYSSYNSNSSSLSTYLSSLSSSSLSSLSSLSTYLYNTNSSSLYYSSSLYNSNSSSLSTYLYNTNSSLSTYLYNTNISYIVSSLIFILLLISIDGTILEQLAKLLAQQNHYDG